MGRSFASISHSLDLSLEQTRWFISLCKMPIEYRLVFTFIQTPFIILVFDFISKQHLVSLSTIAIFFSTWTAVTFLSYYTSISWLLQHRLCVLFLVSLGLWLACGYQALEIFLGSTSERTRQISWIVLGFLLFSIVFSIVRGLTLLISALILFDQF